MQKMKNARNCTRRLLAVLLVWTVFMGFSAKAQAAELNFGAEEFSEAGLHLKEPSEADNDSESNENEETLKPSKLVAWKGVALNAPQSFCAEAVKNGIKLSWKGNKKIQKYELYRKETGTSSYKLIKTTKQTSFMDTGAKYGVSYTYKVRAVRVLEGKTYTSDCSKPGSCCSYRIDPSKPMVALTYDDGPSSYTAQILDILEKCNARATFFEVGIRVGQYPNTVKRIAGMGCELGNHSYDHANLGIADAAKVQSELSQTDSKIKGLTMKAPALVRPPYGSIGSNLKSYAKRPLILWSIDTLDWKTRNASSVYQSVMNHVKDGDIILMHDLYASTVEASKRIIPDLVAKGYQLVTVSELAQYKKVTLRAGEKYSHM